MSRRNAALLDGLAQRAIEFIRREYERRQGKVDVISVAFSGGKDSVAVLDLVQRALPPDAFMVVFGDTTMELSATYEAVEAAKRHWPQLTFLTARSHLPAAETWKLFGPPSRFQRWCCSVHKSAPSLLLLREHTGSPSFGSLVYEGVRASESSTRSTYDAVAAGYKHTSQTNARPLLGWSASEVYLYVLSRSLPLHAGYRTGLTRVGCSVCPFGSSWSESISGSAWLSDIEPFLKLLAEESPDRNTDQAGRSYIEEGLWKRRAGGRTSSSARLKVLDRQSADCLELTMVKPSESWREWAKALGAVTLEGQNTGTIRRGDLVLPFSMEQVNGSTTVAVKQLSTADRFIVSFVRALGYKAAYCVHCRACEANCPTGALSIGERVQIDEQLCVHCCECLSHIETGCLVAKSLQIGKGTGVIKGLDRYCTFGLRASWLEQFLRNPNEWWGSEAIGPRQLVGMRAWLADAEIIDGGSLTVFGSAIHRLGAHSDLSWSLIWANLARNSALVNWFISRVPFGSTMAKPELIDLMGQGLSTRTRANAATSLVQLLQHTPLGDRLGLGRLSTGGRTTSVTKNKMDDPPQLAILYSTYRLAESLGQTDLTLHDLAQEQSEGPVALYGMSESQLVRNLQGLASQYPSLLHVEFARGLENIALPGGISAVETLSRA